MIIFDCGKEFPIWIICNEQDIDIYFSDPGTPSQRALNENANGLLRKIGYQKKWITVSLHKPLFQVFLHEETTC